MKTIEALAREVFELVEFDQGRSSISEGMGVLRTRDELFSKVRGALYYNERVSLKLRDWLAKYGQRR